MRREMELRDEVFQRKLALGKLKIFRIVLHPLAQLDGPAARYIVRNLDGLDPLVFHG